MAEFVFPTRAELRAVEQVIVPNLMADRAIFEIFPTRDVDAHMLVWEQKDNYTGLQAVRGLDGAFTRVNKVGAKRYEEEPGVYGEFIDLNETELTSRRRLGSFDQPVDVSDLVRDQQDHLLARRLDRIEWIGWTLLATGVYSVAGPTGGVIHKGQYTLQTVTAGVVWATTATATPLANFREAQLLGPGYGANFGNQATAWMNRVTWNSLVSNTNSADLGGRFTVLQNTTRGIESVNAILTNEDLPRIRIYDNGYVNDAGTFTRFIPNNKVVIVGGRPAGQTIGEYRFTRNINNDGMAPGPYTEVRRREEPPKTLGVYDGHNGGPVVWYPGSVVVMTV